MGDECPPEQGSFAWAVDDESSSSAAPVAGRSRARPRPSTGAAAAGAAAMEHPPRPSRSLGSDDSQPSYLTPAQVARIYQLLRSTVVQLCREGRIPGTVKAGKHWRVLRAALELEMSRLAEKAHARVRGQLEGRGEAPRSAQGLDRPRLEEGGG